MDVYNSSVGSNQDDSDITIIHSSIIHEHHDEYVDHTQTTVSPASAATPTTATQSADENSHNNHDYIFVDHNPKEQAKQLEQVLAFYTRDLRQESKSQLACAQQLVIRLMDLIRPAYPHDQKKMIELDRVMNEIAELHDKRHLEQKEKDEQLRTEICHLNKTLCAARNEQPTYDSMPRNYSAMNSLLPGSMDRPENWTEIGDDTEKLHQIVQTQRTQINEIVNLVSEAATAAASLETPKTSGDQAEAMSLEVEPSPAPDRSLVTALIERIRRVTTQGQPAAAPEAILQNHSPGASPTQSLATLTLTSINPVHQEPPVQRAEPTPEIVREESILAADGAAAFIREIEPKRCPVCDHQFDPTLPDAEVYDHIDKCLFPTVPKPEAQDFQCPECNRKWPLIDEHGYLQHLSDCFNREV